MNFELIATGIVAILACFFGYKLNKVMLSIFGFIAGYRLCISLLGSMIGNEMLLTILAIIAGLFTGFIAFKIYLVGVFIFCFLLVYLLCQEFIDAEKYKQLTGIIGGILIGFIGVKYTKPIIIAGTSLMGAFMAVNSFLPLFGIDNLVMKIIAGILIAFLGFSFQTSTTQGEE